MSEAQSIIIPLQQFAATMPETDVQCSVSSRQISPDMMPEAYLALYFPGIRKQTVSSVFGSTTFRSALYGGRIYHPEHSLTRAQQRWLEDHGIGLSLTLTNHYFDEEVYRESLPLLKAHHRPGNTIICTNDSLAHRIRNDFPDYALNGSLIKNLNTHEKIAAALDLYDLVVLPMELNTDLSFLSALPDKGRIMLFGNASCAFNCPARTCYVGISRRNRGEPPGKAVCSRKRISRENKGYLLFDIARFYKMGFRHFKFVAVENSGAISVAAILSHKQNWFIRTETKSRPLAEICSFPKAGRTWLRFILAQYLVWQLQMKCRVTLESMFHLLPNNVGDAAKGPAGYWLTDRKDLPLLLFSHNCPEAASLAEKISVTRILLVRNAAETLISCYYHYNFHSGENSDGGDLRASLPGRLKKMVAYYNSWADIFRQQPPLIMSYADMHADTFGTMSRVLEALHIPLDADNLRAAIDASAFSRMQAAEAEIPVPRTLHEADDPPVSRMRRGKSGAAAEELGAEDIRFVTDYLKAHLDPVVLRVLGDKLMKQQRCSER